MNWQKIVFFAFALSISFTYVPMITLVAGAIILAIYNREEIKNLAGKSVSFSQVLFLGFAVSVAVQAVLTIIFGASFEDLVQAGGLFTALKNPAAIQSGVTKEVFTLIIVFCTTYLVVTSPTPQRWVFKWAIGLSLVALTFQCWNVNVGSQARHTMRLSLLREEILANIDSRIKSLGLSLNRDTVLNEHVAEVPAFYYATADAYLYFKDGAGVKRGEIVTVGSKWFHLIDSEIITDKATGLIYEPVASYDDETKHGWLRVDRLSKSVTTSKVASLPTPVTAPVVPTSVAPVNTSLPKVAEVETVQPVTPVEKNSNSVVVTTGDWVATDIVPNFGDRIEFGRFQTPDDVKRLEARINGGIIPALMPRQTDDGRWSAILNFDTGGKNVERHQIELKLKYGLPLTVVVQKL